MVRSALILVSIIVILSGCGQKENVEIRFRNPEVYIFLAHIYATDSTIDERIPQIKRPDHHFWLGGDIYLNTSNSGRMFRYLDYFFDLKSSETHWAVGNHDLWEGTKSIEDYTEKAGDYAIYTKGITLIVMNSNTAGSGIGCEERNKQADFICSVLDTVKYSSHVVLMSHHIFWGEMNQDTLPVRTYANTDHTGRVFRCDPNLKPHEVLYPKFKELVKRKVKVILLAGDMGQKRSAYEYVNDNGITFLGNGGLSNTLYNNEKFQKASSDDSVLVFVHYPDQRTLTWKFINAGN